MMLSQTIGLWVAVGTMAAGSLGKIIRSLPTVTRGLRGLFSRGGTARTVTGAPAGTAPPPRVRGRLGGARIPGAAGGISAGAGGALFYLAQLMGEQQAGAAEFNPATGQYEERELPGGFDQIKDLLFKTDSSKKIAINVKVENETQSAEVDLDTGQVTYGQGG